MRLVPRLVTAGLVGALMVATSTVAQAASPMRAVPAHSSFASSRVGANSDTVAAISRQDRMFLRKAHQGNLAEINAGGLALLRGRCEAVQRVASMLIEDHSRLDTKVSSVADRFDVRLPEAPSAAQQRQLAEVAALSGRKFDVAWLRLQISWHRAAIELGKQELQHGRSPEVVALAREATPIFKHHLRSLHEAEEHC